MAFLGLDVGTTACKAAVLLEDGSLTCISRKEYEIRRPLPGYAELEPEEVWDAVRFCVRETAGRCPETIEALAVSSQGEGCVALDGSFRPVSPIVVSFDARAAEQTKSLEKQFGKKYFFRMGGQILSSMGTLPKILWMNQNRSGLSGLPAKYVCVGDFVMLRLGCPPVTDRSMAARTMMYHIAGKGWNDDLLSAAGIRRDQLCEIQPSGVPVGKIPHPVAAELGLPDGVAAVVGGHDQPCALLGTGAAGTGEAAYSLGTTETLVCASDTFLDGLFEYGLPCYPHVLENYFVTLPGNFTGGNLLQWFRDQFGRQEMDEERRTGKSAYGTLMEEMAEQPSSLYVLPHFTVTGSPWNDSSSAGMVAGLKLGTTRAEFIRGLEEGVTYEILLNLTLLERLSVPVGQLYTVGGGTKSQKLLQLKADILGVPLTVPEIPEAPCRGAALLAAKGCGIPADAFPARRTAGTKTFCPRRRLHEQYLRSFEKYKRLYPAVKSILKE